MHKSIHLVMEDTGLQVEYNDDSGIVIVRLNNFILDSEKSKPGHEVFKENHVVEVYPSVEEVKEIIKILQQILPEEEV